MARSKLSDSQMGVNGDAWLTYNPTPVPSGGAFTTASAAGRYKQIGKTVHLELAVNITNNGTGSGAVSVPLPVNCNNAAMYLGAGRADGVSGKALQVVVNKAGNTGLTIWNYDNTYPGASGEVLRISVTYEAA